MECRFSHPNEGVYLRVLWFYRPEDLPMGPQPYHGQQELVMSNHMDIIEAQTIACPAKITEWDEKDDQQSLEQLYWRQTFDVYSSRLSKVRTYCTCDSEYNPDEVMY
jgi:hypothetical protein